jgi:Flp pilus assembly protein TadG
MAASIPFANMVSRLGRHLRRLLGTEGCTAGVAAIEFGIIAPVLAVALVCTIDLSLGVYRKMEVQNSAQTGAEYALAHGFDATAIASATRNATTWTQHDAQGNTIQAVTATPTPVQFCGCASASGVTSATCGTPCPSGVLPGTYVTVSAQGTYTTLMPYPMLPTSFVFTAQSTVRTQ